MSIIDKDQTAVARSGAAGPIPTSTGPHQKGVDPHAVSLSGYIVDRVYGPESAANRDYATHVGEPGEFPFTRGVHPGMYRTRGWTMRQFAGFGSADDTNQRFKYLLAQAAHGGTNTGLSTAFDLPTLMGRDSDDPLAAGEVGRCGVAIDTIDDMHRLYADIPLEDVTVSQTINGPAAIIWAMYLAMAKERGFDIAKMGGTLQNDILKEFHAQNEFIYPPDPSVKLVVDTIEFQSKHMPRWNSVSISGYHIREAGSTATQELAFTLRDGMEYVEAAMERGLDVDDFGPRLSFFFNSHNEFFEEICKLRAARRIWAYAMRDRYGAKSAKSWLMRTHVQTAGCSLTEQQPYNNIVRVAYQVLAGVLGGCQSLHADSFDETLGLPTEDAVTIALRTQQIVAHETGVTRTVDPLGGSYYVEALTDAMEADANAIIKEIDDLGGVVAGINRGYFRRSIAEASYRQGQEMEAGHRIIVGVNAYRNEKEERPCDILYIPQEVEDQQIERLAAFKKSRSGDEVNRALNGIREAARKDENVMYALVEAATARCTLGEMVQALADIYGRYTSGPEW